MPVEIQFPDIGETVEVADDATEAQIQAIRSDLLRSRAPRPADSIPTVAPTGDPNIPEPESNKAADFARRAVSGVQSGIGGTIKGAARAADMAQDVAPVQTFSGFGGVGLPVPAAVQKVNTQIEQDRSERSGSRQSRLLESLPYQLGKVIAEEAPSTFGVDPARDDEFMAKLATAAGEMFPTLVAGAVLGPVGVMAQYGSVAGERQAEEAVQAGRPDAADVAFLNAAALGALSEALIGVPGKFWAIVKGARKAGVKPNSFNKWVNKNPVKGGIVRAGSEGFIRESSQEAIEQVGGNVIASDIAGYDPTRKASKGVVEAAALGGVLGGLVGGGGGGLYNANRNLTAQSLKETREGPLNLKKVSMLPHFEKASVQPFVTRRSNEGYQAPDFTPRVEVSIPEAPATMEAVNQTVAEFAPLEPVQALEVPLVDGAVSDNKIADLKRELAVEQKKLDKQTAKIGGSVPPPIIAEISRKIANNMAKIQDAIDVLEAKQVPEPQPKEVPNEIAKPSPTIPTPAGPRDVLIEPAGVIEPATITEIAPSNPRLRPVSPEIPVKGIEVDPVLIPQFKEDANPKTGEVHGEELKGSTYERPANPIVVWELLNGRRVVVTGRHRFALAQRLGEETIPATIVREADGFTQSKAITLDAEFNIRDGTGSVDDYATYFENTNISKTEASSRGLLDRAKGKAAWDLAKSASDDLKALYKSGKIGQEKAVAIAREAPADDATQRLGIKYALAGKPMDFIVNVMKASQAEAGSRSKTMDLFGSDDSAMKEMEERAGRASSIQRDLADKVRAVQGAARSPAKAKELGVDVADPEGLVKKVAEIKAEIQRWNDWPLHRDLVAKVKGENFSLNEPESIAEQKARFAADKSKADQQAGKNKLDELASNPLKGTPGDLGQGDLLRPEDDLFAPPTPNPKQFGAENKLVSPERAEELRLAIRDKLGRSSAGIDPVLLANITELGVFYLEGGVRAFPVWSRKMIEDFGPQVIPWLRSTYEGARWVPGNVYEKEMSSYKEVRVLSEKYLSGEQPSAVIEKPDVPQGERNPDTGIKETSITAQRAERGVEPLERGAKQPWELARQAAVDRIAQDSTWLDTLQAEITANVRPLDLTEIAGMEMRMSELRQRHQTASDQMAAAHEAGRADKAQALFTGVQSLSNQLRETEKAVGIGGAASETGRRLGGLRMMMADDFTLAKMEQTWRDDHVGRSPNVTEFLEIKADHKRLQEALKTAEAAEAKARAEAAEAETRAVLAEVRAMKSEIPPQIKSIVDRIGETLDRRADAARSRLKGKLLSLSPADLKDLAEIGAANIYHVGLDFARWSKAMIDELGEKVTPYLKDVFDAAQKQIDGTTDKVAAGPNKEQVKRVVTKQSSEDAKLDLLVKIETKTKAGDNDIVGLVQKLARQFVEDGITEREPLLDALHDALKTVDPEISRREVQDALTGYGKFTLPKQDPVSKTLADLKGQALETGKLLDLEAGEPLKPTGFLRGKMSDVRRRLVAQVNEAKRRFGIVPMDAGAHLATALETRKTARKNQISDLAEQIKTRKKFSRDRTPSPSDPELEALTKHVEELKQEFKDIFGDPTMSPENRLKIATAIAERTQTAWGQRLANAKKGKFGPLDKPTKPTITGPALEAIRARTEAMRQEVKELESIANPKLTPDQRALKTYNTRLANETAKLREKMAAGDFTPTPKRKPFDISKDAPTMRAKAEFENLKNEWIRKGAEARQASLKGLAKAQDMALEAMNLQQNLVSSYDLSALRQAAFQMLNPFKASDNAKAIVDMIRGLSKERAEIMYQEIVNRPNSKNGAYAMAKIRLVDPHESNLRAQDESIRGRWAEKIPNIAASNRAFITLLNRVRADSFDAIYESTGNKSQVATRALGAFVNDATGYGDLGSGKLGRTADALSTVLWSPRLLASRFRLLTGASMIKGTPETRRLIATEYAKTLMGMGAMYTLAQMAGMEVEDDPKSSDFLKLQDGNVRLDPMGGLIQVTVLGSRVFTGEMTTIKGDTKDIKLMEVGSRFLRSKLRPLIGTGIDIYEGENIVGETVTATTVAKNLFIPMSFRDIFDVMEEAGVAKGTAYEILSIFGAGLQVYDENAKTR